MPDTAAERFDRKQGQIVKDPQPIKNNKEGTVVKDQFYISEEERKELGVNENEQLKWVRNPRNWMNVELKDRIREVKSEFDGARAITKDGEMVTLGDLTLVAVPEQVQQKINRTEEEERRKFQEFSDGNSDLEELPTRWRSDDPEWQKSAINDMMKHEYESNIMKGLIGPTQGMDWRTIISMPGGKERYERDFEENALRGMTKIERDTAPQQAAPKKGKLFSMGAHLKNGKLIRD